MMPALELAEKELDQEKQETAPGEDMERFGATYYLFCLASAASNSAMREAC